MWWLVGVLFTLAIGLRHRVGGDWWAYLLYLERATPLSLAEVLNSTDPGYILVNWLVAQFDGPIYWVNLICGAVLMIGVMSFSRRQPLPWLALLVAVPYLIIVVGMGYTRQAVALGFLLISLSSLARSKIGWFVFWVMLGATFHKSAVLILPVAALASTSNRLWNFTWVGLMFVVGGYLFLFDSAEHLWINYVQADYQSEGGLIRVLMNSVPAALFFLLHRRLRLSEAERKLWLWMSLLALVCIPLVVVSSAATDRVALYLIPLQIFVFSRLPLVSANPHFRGAIALGVVGYYALVQAVWLFFATHSFAWVPYQNVLWFGGW
ncbi:MAG: EpsG family protein [Alcanivoracaceae bacterium]|nr:EpsG family protein [Alcanivoracaceae bacterium]